MSKDDRTRTWTFEGYPNDSLPPNYREILGDELKLEYIEGPVHDKDTNPDGTTKKPHIHFVLLFEGNKSYEQVKEITDLLHCPIPQKVRSVQGIVRYLIHKDNPEKWQYKLSDIHVHGNIDINDYFKPSQTEILTDTKEIQKFIKDNYISEYSELCDYLLDMENNWYYVVTSCKTLHFKTYLNSRRYKSERNQK